MKKKKIIYLGLIIIALIGILGLTYAFFTYDELGQNQQLVLGDIYMHYNETDTTISIRDMMPTSQPSSDYFQFTISGKNTSTKDNIIYNIQLAHGENTTDRTQRINDKFLKFRLTDGNDNIIVDNLSFNEINNTTIYSDIISKNTNEEISTTYKLYMWLSNDIVICSGDIKASCDYYLSTQDETKDWNNLYASIKVNVNGVTTESNLQDFEISGSNTITLKNSGVTNSKYELINMTKNTSQANLLADTSTVTWEISPTTNDIQIEDGLVTISETNTLDEFTIKATTDNITFQKDVTLYSPISLPENLLDINTLYDGEFCGHNSGNFFTSNDGDIYATYSRTNYIETSDNKTLFLKTNTNYVAPAIITFFDENKNYISGLEEDIRTNLSVYSVNEVLLSGKTIEIPKHAKFMIINVKTEFLADDVYNYYYVNNENLELYDNINLSFEQTNTLEGIKIANFGDSIFGNYVSPKDISSYLNTYFGSQNFNVAFGGTRMSSHSVEPYMYFSMHKLVDSIHNNDFSLQESSNKSSFKTNLNTLKNIDFNNIDYVTLGFGTNDYTSNILLEDENSFNINTYMGATRYSIYKLKLVNPNIKIILLTPIYRFWSEYEDATNRLNSKYLHLSEYGNALKKISLEYENVYVYDGYSDLDINNANKYVYFDFNDNTHPNDNGIRLYAYKLGKFIESIENQQQ